MAMNRPVINISGNAATATNATNAIGYSQTWQNVFSSRVISTTYTNSTGKPIQVLAVVNITGTGTSVTVSGVTILTNGSVTEYEPLSFVVPNGATYSINAGVLISWTELR